MFESSLKGEEGASEPAQSMHAVIIGAGFSGLYAAIRLQNLGYKVTILEKRGDLGGACGSVSFEGEKYELANQIGVSAIKLLEAAGIKFEIKRVNNEMHFVDGTVLKTPFDLKTIWNLLYPYGLYSIVKSIWFAEYKRPLSDLSVRLNPKFSNLLQGMFGYPSSNPAIKIGQLQQILRDEGGYSTPSVPSEGMPSVVELMAQQIRSNGGVILCHQECVEIVRSGTHRRVKTPDREYQADVVFSSVHGWQEYPSDSIPGLQITTLFLNMDNRFQYPENIQTMAFMPDNILEWFNILDSNDVPSAFPHDFGFHCFRNRLKGSNNLTIFVPTPRRMTNFGQDDKESIIRYVMEKLKRRLPNLDSHIQKMHIFTPSEFNKEFGLSMQVPLLIPQAGLILNQTNEEKGIYLIGSSAFPTSPNIYGAVASVDHLISALSLDPRNKKEVSFSSNLAH